MHVGDAAVSDPGLGAIEHPLVFRFVVDRSGAQRGDVAAGVGLGDAKGGDLDVVGGPVTLGHPLHLLGRGAVGDDRRHAQTRAHDGHTEPGVPPGEFLERDHHR